jgi:hypothetical protein
MANGTKIENDKIGNSWYNVNFFFVKKSDEKKKKEVVYVF